MPAVGMKAPASIPWAELPGVVSTGFFAEEGLIQHPENDTAFLAETPGCRKEKLQPQQPGYQPLK